MSLFLIKYSTARITHKRKSRHLQHIFWLSGLGSQSGRMKIRNIGLLSDYETIRQFGLPDYQSSNKVIVEYRKRMPLLEKTDIIAQARQGFDGRLHTEEYRKIHSDQAHLEALIQFWRSGPPPITWTSAPATATWPSRWPAASRISSSPAWISPPTPSARTRRSCANADQQPGVLEYDGGRLPLEDASCWGSICRYAFHHFPDPFTSARDLSRVTQPHGFVILADPITYDEDTGGFIDRFQMLKQDGHVTITGCRNWMMSSSRMGSPGRCSSSRS